MSPSVLSSKTPAKMPRALSPDRQQLLANNSTPLPLVANNNEPPSQQQPRHGLLGAVKRRLLSQSSSKRQISYGTIPDDEEDDAEQPITTSTPSPLPSPPQQKHSHDEERSSAFILNRAELYLRFIFIGAAVYSILCFFFGLSRILAYLAVAWGTTALLRGLVLYTQWKHEQRRRILLDDDETRVIPSDHPVDDDDEEQVRSSPPRPFFMVDTATHARVIPGTLFPLDNEIFSGHFLLLLNRDDPQDDHFRNKQRRFEFQFQIQVKKLPPDPTIFFSCSVKNPVQFNVWQRVLVNTAMALCRGVIYEPGASMAFELSTGMDRIISTPLGQTPPVLGQDPLPASNLTAPVQWRLDCVYTFALWSKYVDFLQWECQGIAGVRNFTLSTLLGRQPLYFGVAAAGTTEPMVELEVSHQHFTDPGTAAQRHAEMTETGNWSLAQGIYVRSGEWWHLQAGTSFLADGGGFCILNPHGASKVCMENRQRSLLQNGDTVTVKLADGGVTKYMTIHRGWWLKWVSTAPTMNGYFTIHFDSDYLIVGGSFVLRHKRWSGYRVGVASEGSATYGGRMLGLHEENDDWMQQLQLCALDPSSTAGVLEQARDLDRDGSVGLAFSEKQHRMDVPAYIEVMNRQSRVLQYVYVVRVATAGWVRLRTGRDLAQVMQRGYAAMSGQSSPRQVTTTGSFELSVAEPSEDDWEIESEDGFELYDSFDESLDAAKPERRKGRKLINKIAQSVKSTTTNAARTTGNAGKLVVSHSVKGTMNAGKATVNAGKAILPIRPKKPPVKEPKSAKRRSYRPRSRDLHVNVNSRTVKRGESFGTQKRELCALAGELSAPEQSCRTVSDRVATMSAEPESSPFAEDFSVLLASLVESQEDRDKKFLRGKAVDVGVLPAHEGEGLICESLVARCLWESHWREEWCGMYATGLVFYAPLTTEHCLELRWDEIKSVRLIDDDLNPLSGYPLLAVETEWLCHYCAFVDAEARQKFWEQMEQERVNNTDPAPSPGISFLHGFDTSVDASRSIGQGKWARVSSGTKMKNRVVLNCRRMAFDLDETPVDDAASFAEKLLSIALSLSIDTLKEQQDVLSYFLDAVSYLKSISLEKLDPDSPESFCFFANIYHCLLQHAMLFSVNGSLNKKSFRHFMRTSCYEVGPDVFSLAELYCFVLRGNMCRSQVSRPPFMDAPRKSESFRDYALGFRRAETNFLLSTGDMAFPDSVPVVNPVELVDQLELQTSLVLQKNVVVDDQKKCIILPKVLDVYKGDFFPDSVSSNLEVVRYVLNYLDAVSQDIVRRWLEEDPNSIVVRYQFPSEKFYSRLCPGDGSPRTLAEDVVTS